MDALSELMPSIHRPHLEQTDRKCCSLSTTGAAGLGSLTAVAQTSRVPSVLQRCQSPTTGLRERNHPGHAGTLGIVMLFEGINP